MECYCPLARRHLYVNAQCSGNYGVFSGAVVYAAGYNALIDMPLCTLLSCTICTLHTAQLMYPELYGAGWHPREIHERVLQLCVSGQLLRFFENF